MTGDLDRAIAAAAAALLYAGCSRGSAHRLARIAVEEAAPYIDRGTEADG